ncbi:MAG: hypothetical protein JWP61_1458 [Friedmanniella sp.]|nr:hypothetical protein [Friedmanniella sp.]
MCQHGRVGLSPKLLGADEHEIVHTRTHAKALILPAAALVAVGAAVGAGAALVPRDYRPVGQLAILALGAVLVVWWVLVPFLRWRTTTYTVTDRRLITRRGVLAKTSLELPLNRINDVASERSLLDRMLGCGTLNVSTAAEGGTISLRDVPDVEHVHAEMTELLFGDPAFPDWSGSASRP